MAKNEVTFSIINFNLKSKSRKGEEAYSQIIETIFKSRKIEQIASDRAAILRTQFKDVKGKYVIYYGYISKFTTIDDANWLNYKKMEPEKFELPKDLFPNLKETTYIFVPELHRMAILASNQFSLLNAEKFFQKSAVNALNTGESIKVNIEKDMGEFKRLLSAKRITRLELEITYSNADITKDMVKLMDDELRNSGIGNIKVTATPDANDNIDLDKSGTLAGLTGLSESNGYAKATIIGENSKKEVVDTRNHPRKVKTKIVGEDMLKSIANKLGELFRPQQNNSNNE